MPPKPKKPIEELLEASAQARRAEFGSDPKMPNPMRARLQDEVALLAREPEPEARSRWFAFSWPRLAIGAAFASLIAALSVVWWQARQASEFGPLVALDQKATAPEISQTEPANYPASATAQRGPAETDKSEARVNDEAKTGQLAKAAPASQPALQNFRPSAAGSASAGVAANFKQQFSQSAAKKMAARAARPPPAPKLLDSFQVEQNGRDIRVVDDDGSTYAGRIELLVGSDTRNYFKEKERDAAPAAPSTVAKQTEAAQEIPDNEFYFRASGFNTSLKKSVVFEGNYIVPAPAGQKDRADGAGQNESQRNARIVGTAQVSGEPPVEIDAVAVPAK